MRNKWEENFHNAIIIGTIVHYTTTQSHNNQSRSNNCSWDNGDHNKDDAHHRNRVRQTCNWYFSQLFKTNPPKIYLRGGTHDTILCALVVFLWTIVLIKPRGWGVDGHTIWGVKRVCVCMGVHGVVGGVGWIANYLCRCRWPRLGRGVGRGAQAVCGLWLHFACSTRLDPLSHAKSTPNVMSNLFVQL